MKRLALILFLAAAPTAAADTPDPPRVVARLDAHDRELAALRRELAGLKSQLEARSAFAQAAPAAALPPAPVPMATYAAPPGDGWAWTGAAWTRPFPGSSAVTFQVVPAGSHAHVTTDGVTVTHGNENFGSVAAHAGIARPWIRVAEAGQRIRVAGNCPNGQCPR